MTEAAKEKEKVLKGVKLKVGESIYFIMDSLTQSVTELNGSVGALMAELKKAEYRIRQLEAASAGVTLVAAPIEIPLRGPVNEDDLKEIGRLPDSVRDLQVFEGNPSQYVSWVTSVEGILDDYKIIKARPLYRAILKSIRGKVRGNADSALISHNISEVDWPGIKNCLSLHYADKRDIRTLEHQLGQLTQGGLRLDEFYARVNHQFSLIINKLKTENYSAETVGALMETYRNRALDIFIRGLNGDLSRMIIVQKPRSLPEAYTACLDIQNLNFRNQPVHGGVNRNTVTVPMNTMSGDSKPHPSVSKFSGNFRPAGNDYKFGFRPRSGSFQNHTFSRKPEMYRPVEKMEVDPSAQTRRSFSNKPQQGFSFKRKLGSDNYPQKQQRMFHMEAIDEEYAQVVGDNVEDQVNFMTGAYPAYLT